MWGQYPGNPSYLTDLPNNINQINDLGTAADKLIYTSAYTTFTNYEWTKVSVEAATKSWNDAAINDDASAIYLAADSGVYISTDDGSSWASYNPRVETCNEVGCADSGGKAIALGDDSRKEGVVMITSDYGENWTEKTVTV